jgi:hypothetical protein
MMKSLGSAISELLQFIFPLSTAESSEYKLPGNTFSRLGDHRVNYNVYPRKWPREASPRSGPAKAGSEGVDDSIKGLFDGRRDASSRTKRISNVMALGY